MKRQIFRLTEKIWASLRPLLGELERFYAWANGVCFGGRLSPHVVITVAPRGRRKDPGWSTAARWQGRRRAADRPHEIVLAAEHLDRPPLEICHTVLEEMVHLANAEQGIQDLHPLRQYHNRKFKTAAQAVGLKVEKDGARGWSQTILTPELRRRIQEDFRPDGAKFRAFRPPMGRPKAPPTFRKWQCACPISIWSKAAEVPARCERCRARFARAERGRARPRRPAPAGPDGLTRNRLMVEG